MGCGTGSTNNFGLINGHAYSLIGAYTIKDSSNVVTNRLYKVRNPWGNDIDFTGNWRDTDTVHWTDSAKAQVSMTANL
jgi:Calpain family cysteine protease